ncbi:MAG: hypothetical protein WCG78_02830 [Candidatus Omnitrophota bacterium]
MKAGKKYIIALMAALALYVGATTYTIARLEARLGHMEHFLIHQGYDESRCSARK